VDEKLSAHHIEGEMVHNPHKHKETGRIPEPIPDSCQISHQDYVIDIALMIHTIRDWLNSSSSSQEIGAKNADVDGERYNTGPPADDVAYEVDLLLGLVLCPEADPTQEEWPVDRIAGVWVRRRETGIVLHHQQLQLCKLLEKVSRNWNLRIALTCPINWVETI
jgi:hypothetical protein